MKKRTLLKGDFLKTSFAFILALIAIISIWTTRGNDIIGVFSKVSPDSQLARTQGSWPFRADIYPSSYTYDLTKITQSALKALNPGASQGAKDTTRLTFKYVKATPLKYEVTKSRDDTKEIDPDDILSDTESYTKKETLPTFYAKTYGKTYSDNYCVLNYTDKTASTFVNNYDDRGKPLISKKLFGEEAISSCADVMKSYPPSELALGGGVLSGTITSANTSQILELSAVSRFDLLIRDNPSTPSGEMYTIKIHVSGDKVVLDKTDNKFSTRVERPLKCSEMKLSINGATVKASEEAKTKDSNSISDRQNCVALYKVMSTDSGRLKPKRIEAESTVPAYNMNVWIADPKKDIKAGWYQPQP